MGVDRWRQVEKESGVQLLHLHGSLDLARRGTRGIDTLHRYEQAMARQNIP